MPSPHLPSPLRRARPGWSSLLALVGMLAVLLGVQASRVEAGRSLTASAHAAPLPELRALTPAPDEGAGTPALPAPARACTWQRAEAAPAACTLAPADLPRATLALLGRRQAEGG